MSTAEAKLNPIELWKESVSAWTDLSRSAGEAWFETMLAMRPDAETSASPEDMTRNMFRKLADLNIQR